MDKNNIGIYPADILLPKNKYDLNKWAVIACDQFTSKPSYWEQLDKLVGTQESALRLVFPEVYLGKDDDKRIKKINSTIEQYLNDDVFDTIKDSFVLVQRQTSYQRQRLGLIAMADLENYSFEKGSRSLIRATEDTIIERIPPRIKIRKDAKIELPHIMLLIDDPQKTVIEQAFADPKKQLLYDFELNMGGGHIKGYRAANNTAIIEALQRLNSKEVFLKKYGREDAMLFAVGDGNHSLATAKQHWENVKKTLSKDEIDNHPARFALVEIVNLYDEGLLFEPIHRVIFGYENDFRKNFCDTFARYEGVGHLMSAKGKTAVNIPADTLEAVIEIQRMVDSFLAHYDAEIDYIHGENELQELTSSKGVGVLMPKLQKSDLFRCVIERGALPRKTFSMGEAEEKRYYLEAKKIVK